ncbi:MAG: LysE family translocator, partial [Chloroflexota bacterium]
MSLEFFLTSLIVVLVPGTGVIYTVSIGLVHHWRASLVSAIGCT